MRSVAVSLLTALTIGFSGCNERDKTTVGFNGTISSLTTTEKSCVVAVKNKNIIISVVKKNLNYCKNLRRGDKVFLVLSLKTSPITSKELIRLE